MRPCDIVLTGHARGGRQHPMGADEVDALPEAFARQSNGLVVVAPDELRVGGDAAKNRRKRIARAQPQRAPRGNAAFFPPPGIGQHQTVIALRQREVWIEPKRELQFGQRILKTPLKQIGGASALWAHGSSLSARIAASAARSATGTTAAISAQPIWALNVWLVASTPSAWP